MRAALTPGGCGAHQRCGDTGTRRGGGSGSGLGVPVVAAQEPGWRGPRRRSAAAWTPRPVAHPPFRAPPTLPPTLPPGESLLSSLPPLRTAPAAAGRGRTPPAMAAATTPPIAAAVAAAPSPPASMPMVWGAAAVASVSIGGVKGGARAPQPSTTPPPRTILSRQSPHPAVEIQSTAVGA
ncbi:hypothetical protein I4F81_008056 [Pyropia yezoensis]|uniref:Uncharacterized protein n=1 Tax=Pyropia yezoensis TaxID=2788 RepID=A0ACC3C6A7_PYRYE|nr:hypothetical protein I4F81_008056 [Neopyropia yezoensis]